MPAARAGHTRSRTLWSAQTPPHEYPSAPRRGCCCYHFPSRGGRTVREATHLPKSTQLRKGRAGLQTQVSLCALGSQPLTQRPSWERGGAALGKGCLEPHFALLSRVPLAKVSEPWHSGPAGPTSPRKGSLRSLSIRQGRLVPAPLQCRRGQAQVLGWNNGLRTSHRGC